MNGVTKGDMFMWSPEELTRNLFHNQEIAAARCRSLRMTRNCSSSSRTALMTAKLGWSPRFYNPDLQKWLHRINVPTLIIWGDDDKLIPGPPTGRPTATSSPMRRSTSFPNAATCRRSRRRTNSPRTVVDFIGGARDEDFT